MGIWLAIILTIFGVITCIVARGRHVKGDNLIIALLSAIVMIAIALVSAAVFIVAGGIGLVLFAKSSQDEKAIPDVVPAE